MDAIDSSSLFSGLIAGLIVVAGQAAAGWRADRKEHGARERAKLEQLLTEVNELAEKAMRLQIDIDNYRREHPNQRLKVPTDDVTAILHAATQMTQAAVRILDSPLHAKVRKLANQIAAAGTQMHDDKKAITFQRVWIDATALSYEVGTQIAMLDASIFTRTRIRMRQRFRNAARAEAPAPEQNPAS